MANSRKLSDLVRQCVKNPEVFSDIYNEFFDKIYRFVYFRVNHKETAEDLTEEVFIKAYESLPLLKNPDIFTPWLYQITKNLIIDHYRKSGKVVLEDITSVAAMNLVDTSYIKPLEYSLAKAIDKLPEEQSQIIKLRYLEDLDYATISRLIGKSEVNVRVIQHRALKNLKKLKDEI